MAYADGDQSATTMVDMAQFFEHVRAEEYCRGGRNAGIPQCVLSLTTHLYLGPRRIRVRQAYSDELFPAWSVLAGCTWATVHVRLLIIRPVEKFIGQMGSQFRCWGVSLRVSFYIDDGVATTTGALESVTMVHARITRALIQFIRCVLNKKIVDSKIQCVASTANLRKGLGEQLKSSGISVNSNADLLGTDYSAGAA